MPDKLLTHPRQPEHLKEGLDARPDVEFLLRETVFNERAVIIIMAVVLEMLNRYLLMPGLPTTQT